MEIRAITIGVNLSHPLKKSSLIMCGHSHAEAKKVFEKNRLTVQTLRLTTQPWTDYLGGLTKRQVISEVKNVEDIGVDNGIDFVSIGAIRAPHSVEFIPDIIAETSRVSASVTIVDKNAGIDYEASKRAAWAIKSIAEKTAGGYGNFRFAAIANCPPDIPFYPGSFHKGRTCFSIALECSDLVTEAFDRATDFKTVGNRLRSVFEHELKKVKRIARKIEKKERILFKGIDVSPAPTIKVTHSLPLAFEKLGLGEFGAPGTLAIAGMITRALKSLNVKKCGYSGLMLPIMEDYGLAKKCSMGVIDIDTLLTYSSICGTGLDCVPLPGDISRDKIYAILLDVATLATKLNKPLSARLLPVPDKKAGEMTTFKSPYLADCKILSVK